MTPGIPFHQPHVHMGAPVAAHPPLTSIAEATTMQGDPRGSNIEIGDHSSESRPPTSTCRGWYGYDHYYGEPGFAENHYHRRLHPSGYYTPYPGWSAPTYQDDEGHGSTSAMAWHEPPHPPPPPPPHAHYYGYPLAPPAHLMPAAYGAPC